MKYNRILLKLSGEALSGKDNILDPAFLRETGAQIKRCIDSGIQVAVVCGAGNIWRGGRQHGHSIDRVRADQMGMLATLINSLAIQDAVINAGAECVVMSAIPVGQICENYSQYRAIEHLEAGKAVILACGTGYPFFTTDTGALLRAAEIKADVAMLAKNVDGIYDRDPSKYPDAVKYDRITYDEMIEKDLHAIDTAAGALGRENGLTVLLFELKKPENIYSAACGERVGTILEN
ncbi:MAG: UMP kinase [Clostridiales bacterium]|nr:UMP kinase [Clostridiales bacterium]